MALILTISSHVVRGHVGNAAAVPALQALGHNVMALHTVTFSSHPGHGSVAGLDTPPDTITAILDQLAGHGWLDRLDGVLIGYFRSEQQIDATRPALERLRAASRPPMMMADPILGDLPNGLYVPQPVAEAIRDQILPLVDVITPNRFELAWLSGHDPASIDDALRAARQLRVPPRVLTTSVPANGDQLANVLTGPAEYLFESVFRRDNVPHGTGDLLAALFLGHRLNGRNEEVALRLAVGGVELTLAASVGREELELAAVLPKLRDESLLSLS